jgi:hypothetical protein
MIAAHVPRCRTGALLLIMLAVTIPGLVAGCGVNDSSKPAAVDTTQAKQAQDYMRNYREEIRSANKAKAQAKAAGKKSP